ncbi:MAG: allulose-6-phosphate 3-epimerase [Clostridiales Family XIII bacterium]|jgi:D-allulose-6-phosphate 3-epimerase|nr:allulose-6-phosphate 3-epimerase [Clostridiales Family XIII bacterium]
MMNHGKFSVSLMCMDLLRVKEQLDIIDPLCDRYHIDVVDGSYAKTFCLSQYFVEAIRPVVTKPIDVHLVVERPEDHIDSFARAGADFLSIQCDTISRNAFKVIDDVHSLGCGMSVVLNPADPVETIIHYLDRVDKITVMTVNPGFPGQSFIGAVPAKIQRLDRLRKEKGYGYAIEADGNCGADTFGALSAAGADSFVLGSTGLFGLSPDLGDAWTIMQKNYRESTASIT